MAGVPGARGAAVRARAAADNSPWWARAHARWARAAGSGWEGGRGGLGADCAARRSSQRPS